MRKQTHFKKAVSLALAAAMAVSVCTTALAEGADPGTTEPASNGEIVEETTTDTEQRTTEKKPTTEDSANVEKDTKGTTEDSDQSEQTADVSATTYAAPENGETSAPIATYTAQIKDGDTLSLADFNALTEIPKDVHELTVDIGTQNVSAKGNALIIGSRPTDVGQGKDGIADYYTHTNKNYDALTEEEKARFVGYHGSATTDALLTTNKPGITLHVKGTVIGEMVNSPSPDSPEPIGNNEIRFYVPDNSTVILEDVTINGTVSITGYWEQISANGYNPQSTVPHKLNTIKLQKCTLNGSIYKNGSGEYNFILDGCTFNRFENTAYENNTNPIWYINPGAQDMGWVAKKACNITIQNCTFNANRPVKFEQSIVNATFKIENNTFNMAQDSNFKNDALMFNNSGAAGNIEISNNTMTGGNALLAFYKSVSFTMAENAKFIVKDNELNGAKASVVWKSTDEFKPDFVQVLQTQPITPSTDVKPAKSQVESDELDKVTDKTLKDALESTATSIQLQANDNTQESLENNATVQEMLAKAKETYNTDTALKEAIAKAADAPTALKNADASQITLVSTPYLVVKPLADGTKNENGKTSLSFDIKLYTVLKATTNPNDMDDQNTCTLGSPVEVKNPGAVAIRLDVGNAFSPEQLNSMFVRHEKEDGSVSYLYAYPCDSTNPALLEINNDEGFSKFTLFSDTRLAQVKLEDTLVSITQYNVNRTLPTPKDPTNFKGWSFAGISGTYTTVTEELLDALTKAYNGNGNTPIQATAVYNTVATPAPAATATPAPAATAAPADTNLYYTCVACGYHDWTATDEGYKCNHCGHLESVKQLSGYANVKGVYTPKSGSGAAAAAKAKVTSSAIPQTSDEMPIVPIAIIAIAALLGLGVTAYMKKRG